jgi:hypothetical protein
MSYQIHRQQIVSTKGHWTRDESKVPDYYAVVDSVSEDEPHLEELAAEADACRRAILVVVRAKPYVVWTADELRRRAGISGPVATYATLTLVSRGVLEIDSHLRIGLPYEQRHRAARPSRGGGE